MRVINLTGSPGTGKSTGAAYIFSKLKLKGIEAELVTEYAKQRVYEKSEHVLENQLYVFAKQYKKLKDLQNYGVTVAISDSPLMLSSYYGRNSSYINQLHPLVSRLDGEFENFNVFLKRVKPYNPAGRLQTEEQSDDISYELEHNFGYDFKTEGTEEGYDKIIAEYLKRFPQ